jgi:spore germination cell wall hydrolase CwlJ-like protein
MRFLLLASLMLVSILSAFAGEMVGAPPQSKDAVAALPHCVKGVDANEVAASVKANLANPQQKYVGYQKALQSDSETELFARLVYSEAVAANCPEAAQKIAPLIAQVIANRVRIRGRGIASVVYQYNQFASSLNVYQQSRYQDFLCPKDAGLWKIAMSSAKRSLAGGSAGLDSKTSNYYLYQHDPKKPKEPWTLKEDTSPATIATRSCIKFFIDPNWK